MSGPDKYQQEKKLIRQIFHAHKGRYGYRRIAMQIRQQGYMINHKTVLKLMNMMGLKCMVRAKRYHSYKGDSGAIAPNLLQRNFHATGLNQKWVTDVTVFSLLGEKYYLSPIMDLYNREIVSYSISSRPTFSLVTDMLGKAFVKIPDATNLILHSDQGWHYQMKQYQSLLQKKGIKQSMSNKGNCLDNAVMENFFGLLKSELLYLRKFDSIHQFLDELDDYMHYYNNSRIKGKLKGLSPVQYRTQSLLST